MTIYNIIKTKVQNTAVTTEILGSFIQFDAALVRFQDHVNLLKQNDLNYKRAEETHQVMYDDKIPKATHFGYWNVNPLEPFYLVKVQIVESIVFDNAGKYTLIEFLDRDNQPNITTEYLRSLYEYCQFTLVAQIKIPERIDDI